MIHAQVYASPALTKDFWQLQLSVIVQLRKLRSLALVLAFVPLDHDLKPINHFTSGLKRDGWVVSLTEMYFPHYGDSVAAGSKVILAVHSNTDHKVKPLEIPVPPQKNPPAIAKYMWPQFNTRQYAVAFAKDDEMFNRGAVDGKPAPILPDVSLRATEPKEGPQTYGRASAKVKYLLHRNDADESVAVGAEVYSLDHLCPPLAQQPNKNLFQSTFGVEFSFEGHVYV
jgi:hypothetical protein